MSWRYSTRTHKTYRSCLALIARCKGLQGFRGGWHAAE
ncbi:hypothetical protein [Citrobacter pasteurii]|nr:hypothetical protein [Citrobacter pasteurii]